MYLYAIIFRSFLSENKMFPVHITFYNPKSEPMKKLMLFLLCTVFFTCNNQAQLPADYDGNTYDTIVIGSQTWLKKDLRTTHYLNGVAIPNVTDSASWANAITGARCYYNNDSATFSPIYGALYNWYILSNVNNKICPQGYHVPSDAEITTLENFLGGVLVAGGKMKEDGTLHWLPPNNGATNSSGFTGLPAGMRFFDQSYKYHGQNYFFFSSTSHPADSTYAYGRYLYYLDTGIERDPYPKNVGLCIRCIKDPGTGYEDLDYQQEIKLFPNPADKNITIDIATGLKLNITIYNTTGEIVLQTPARNSSNDIDVSKLSSGLYLIRISGMDLTVQRKFNKK